MNSKHISYSFRHLASILLLLVCGTIGAIGQRLQESSVMGDSLKSVWFDRQLDRMEDSVFTNVEMEDSLSALAIKPVEQPEGLLKQCLNRIKADLKQKHSKRKYLIERQKYNTVKFPFLTVSTELIVENDNGITLGGEHISEEWGELKAEAPYPLTVAEETNIRFLLPLIKPSFSHVQRDERGYTYWSMQCPVYRDLVEFYDIKAYSISDDSGRGVYRIDLVLREIKTTRYERNLAPKDESIRFYFDKNSLRLIQYIHDSYTAPGHRFGRIVEPPGLSHSYKCDYSAENDSPILIRAQGTTTSGQYILNKSSVRLIEEK